MFLRAKTRFKDGKEHRYWSIVENRRTQGKKPGGQQLAIFPDDRVVPTLDCDIVQIKVNELQVRRPRQWGACWLACQLWEPLRLGGFWSDKLPPSRQGTRWLNVFKTLVCYRLIAPGSEFRLVVGQLVAPGSERYSWAWMQTRSAIFEFTGRPIRASLNALYRATDVLFSYKEALEKHLSQAARDLFSLPERLCFFDLSNSYFEGKAAGNGKAKRGHSKEKRSDAPLLTLALIIDEQGFPKYSRLYPGNQYEAKTLGEMIEGLIKARPDLAPDRTVIMDAGNQRWASTASPSRVQSARGRTLRSSTNTWVLTPSRQGHATSENK